MELAILTLEDALRQQREQLKDLEKEAQTRANVLNQKQAVFLLGAEKNLKSFIADYEKAISVLKQADGNPTTEPSALPIADVSCWVAMPDMPDYDGEYLVFIEQPQECGTIWKYQRVVKCEFNEWIINEGEKVTNWKQLDPPPCS